VILEREEARVSESREGEIVRLVSPELVRLGLARVRLERVCRHKRWRHQGLT
jgi:hypothetical protein